MHLLPHKSWNVWSKKNIEKVRKDEENAAAEELNHQKRLIEIDAEHRYDLLKSKLSKTNKQKIENSSEIHQLLASSSDSLIDPSGHFNLFSDIQSSEEHPEVLAEKKNAEERINRYNTVYLAQSSAEVQKNKPWYHYKISPSTQDQDKLSKQIQFKDANDPLNLINKNVKRTKQLQDGLTMKEIQNQEQLTLKIENLQKRNKSQSSEQDSQINGDKEQELWEEKKISIESDKAIKKRKRVHKKDKSHSRKKLKKDGKKERKKNSEQSLNKCKIDREVLRAERIKRENEEKFKLSKTIGLSQTSIKRECSPRGYHPQFLQYSQAVTREQQATQRRGRERRESEGRYFKGTGNTFNESRARLREDY